MKKITCDACGKIAKEGYDRFDFLNHIPGFCGDTKDLLFDKEKDFHYKKTEYDVCVKCYNKIYFKAYKTFLAIREENGIGGTFLGLPLPLEGFKKYKKSSK